MFCQAVSGVTRETVRVKCLKISKNTTQGQSLRKLKESLEGMDGWTDGQTDGQTEKGREGTTCQGKFI